MVVRRATAGGAGLRRISRPLLRLVAVALSAMLAVAAWQVTDRPRHSAPPSTVSGADAPAAIGDVLGRTTSISSPLSAAPPGATLIARTAGVRLLAHGFIDHYGVGSAARSAPPGRRLLAFTLEPRPGEAADAPETEPVLSIRIGAVERGPLVISKDYLVAAVPTGITSSSAGSSSAASSSAGSDGVDLVLTEDGVRQSISLLTGRPNSDRLLVCTRLHRWVGSATPDKGTPADNPRDVTMKVTRADGTSGMTSGTITVESASLSYWAQNLSHPPDRRSAFLHVSANVKLAGDKVGYGAEAALLHLRLPDGTVVPAVNAAANPGEDIDNVFTVPATFTTGTISYAGSISSGLGSQSVVGPVAVPVAIPAG
ncbi:MAG: hypothetical protein QOE71_4084 [Pseudonocardiales bacterium]|jgi:hypothetical protein|nr:hypothetical protein [Pseudonocardiales bacterium]